MSEEKRYTLSDAHAQFGPQTNREVWALLDKQERTREENEHMLYAAYASAYHWLECGTPLNHQRAEWLIARVWCALEQSQPALFHALRCMELTQLHANLLQDFDRAYAFEALARAHALAGNQDESRRCLKEAEVCGQKIQDEKDRSIFEQDFNHGNWYGMR